jgi:hypothetical protein
MLGGYNWTTLSLKKINTENWSSRFGVGNKIKKKSLLRNPKK